MLVRRYWHKLRSPWGLCGYSYELLKYLYLYYDCCRQHQVQADVPLAVEVVGGPAYPIGTIRSQPVNLTPIVKSSGVCAPSIAGSTARAFATRTASPIGTHHRLDRSTGRPGRSESRPRVDKRKSPGRCERPGRGQITGRTEPWQNRPVDGPSNRPRK